MITLERSTPPAILEVPVVPRPANPLFLASMFLAIAAAVTGLCFWLFVAQYGRESQLWLLLFSAAFGLFLAVALVLPMRHVPSPGTLRIEPDHVRWQPTSGPGEQTLSYHDLWSAHTMGRGKEEILMLSAADGRSIQISTCFLPEAGMAGVILERVREQVALLPDGIQRLAGMEERRPVVEARRFPFGSPVTFSAAALLGLVFLAQSVTGALAEPLLLWAFGANSFALVRNGELFRLVTANLLHGGLLHAFFNISALVQLGILLEPLLGAARFLTVLLASALAGAAASAFLGHSFLSLGASTGIAGLIAAYVLILWRRPDWLGTRPTTKTWIWLAVALLWPALVIDNIDHLAHLGGFLAGLVLVFPALYKADLPEMASLHRTFFRVTSALLGAVFLAACGIAVRQALDPARDVKTAAVLLRDPSGASLPPVMLNHLAWEMATSPRSSRGDLELALRGAGRAVEADPGQAEFRDTRATVLDRLGRRREAIEVLHGLAADRTAVHTSRLARFEWAFLSAQGPLVLGERPAVLPRARLVPGPAVLLEPGEARFPPGTALHFVLTREKRPAALLEITTGRSKAFEELRYPLPRELASPIPDSVALTLLDTRAPGRIPGLMQWRIYPVLPEDDR